MKAQTEALRGDAARPSNNGHDVPPQGHATADVQAIALPAAAREAIEGELRGIQARQMALDAYVEGLRVGLGVPDDWRLLGTREGGLLLASPAEAVRLVQPPAQSESKQAEQEGGA